jgi:hypothetical protein
MRTLSNTSRLPPELQALIIQHADRPSLKQCRLVNQAFNQHATAELFRVLPLGLNFQSLRHAVNIARDRHLAAYVKEVVFHGGLIPYTCRAVNSYRRRMTFALEGYDIPPQVLDIEGMRLNYARTPDECKEFEQQVSFLKLRDLVYQLPYVDELDFRTPFLATYDPKGFAESITALPLGPDTSGISLIYVLGHLGHAID